jgi:hypothetical protein
MVFNTQHFRKCVAYWDYCFCFDFDLGICSDSILVSYELGQRVGAFNVFSLICLFRGEKPHGIRLLIYISGTCIGAIFASITAINCYITTPPVYVNNSLKVLRHSGFIPDSDYVHGGISVRIELI